MDDLFKELEPKQQRLGEGALLLRGFIAEYAVQIKDQLKQIVNVAPFRRMVTPSGLPMSVMMTNMGTLGWVTDQQGYRYSATDPITERPWPVMPELFYRLAIEAAKLAGYKGFNLESCLINLYHIGSKMALHQDKDEQNLKAPIVSFSLGIPATFLWGGLKRTDKTVRIPLWHGDALVWGGVDRLRFHGVAPVQAGTHRLFNDCRINMTFRQVHNSI